MYCITICFIITLYISLSIIIMDGQLPSKNTLTSSAREVVGYVWARTDLELLLVL